MFYYDFPVPIIDIALTFYIQIFPDFKVRVEYESERRVHGIKEQQARALLISRLCHISIARKYRVDRQDSIVLANVFWFKLSLVPAAWR